MRAGRFWEDGVDKLLRKQGLDGGRWEQGRGMNDISVLFLPRLTYNHATTSDADTDLLYRKITHDNLGSVSPLPLFFQLGP